MKKFVKSREEDADDSSPLCLLPDEIILQILNKLIDLKSLCFCYLVSRRFSSIVLQVDAISFTTPLINPLMPDNNSFGDVDPSKPRHPIISVVYDPSFQSAFTFLLKFKAVKSLCIELSSSSYIGNDIGCLFKWKAKFGNRIDSVLFLSPDSVSDTDGFQVNGKGEEEEVSGTDGFQVNGKGEEEEDMDLSYDLFSEKLDIAHKCVVDVVSWHIMLLYLIKYLPTMLEEVSITDSVRRGRLSLSGGKLAEVKKRMYSDSETVKSEMKLTKAFIRLSKCYIPVLEMLFVTKVVTRLSMCHIPVLEMPVSGYVMKGVTLFVLEMNDLEIGNDSFMISEDGFEDKEEAAYTEAVMEILKKHKGRMQRLK